MLVGGKPLAFVPVSGTPERIQRLDAAVKNKRLCAVMGPSGSGKTELVGHWGCTWSERASNNPQQFPLFVELPRSRSSTPMAYTVLLRTYTALHRAAGTEYQLRQRQWNEKYQKPTARNIEWLALQVEEMLDRMPICAVVIDNAQMLDTAAFERVLDLRMYYDERYGRKVRRALILVATQEASQTEHPLIKLLAETPEAVAARGEDIELALLTRGDFLWALSKIVDEGLHATFSPALEPDLDTIGKELLAFVQQNWHMLENFAASLDEALGPQTDNRRRVITRAVLDKAKQRPMHLQV